MSYRSRQQHIIEVLDACVNQYQLIPKTIGNRKGDCAWSCSRWQSQPEKICKSQRTNQCHSLRTLYWFVLCNLQIFPGCVCHLEQLHAQSPFLFPILRLRLRLRGICLNRITEKVNGYLSSCVPVGRGWEGENQDILSSKNINTKIRKVICFRTENKQRERERERERAGSRNL